MREIKRVRHGALVCATFGLLLAGCPSEENNTMNNTSGTDMGSEEDMGGSNTSPNNTNPNTNPMELRVSAVMPGLGSVLGGTPVTIDGGGFKPGIKVLFGGVEATGVDVRSSSQLLATTPAAEAPGIVDVVVELPDGSSASKAGAFTYTEGGDETDFFCQLQAQSPVQAVVGAPTATLYAIVYARGRTEGQGAGMGITGEIGYGTSAADYENFAFSPMLYNVDKDGLTPGDMSNDEYGAPLQIDSAGNYRYVARFQTSDAPGEWIYCDLDGSQNGIQPPQLGELLVGEAQTPEITFCRLQAQSPATSVSGMPSSPLYALVFADGLTQGAGQGSLIEGELGYGADASDYENFNYVSMAYNGDQDGLNPGDLANDEYNAALTVSTAGSYRYAARFRTTQPQGDWFYCDLDGNSPDDPFESEELGVLEVEDPGMAAISFCQTELMAAQIEPGQTTMEITGAVYVAGITNMAGQGNGVTAELAWGPRDMDPSTWTEFVSPTYKEDADGLNPGDLANDRYAGQITVANEGDYGFAYRFSLDGGATYSWCDVDGSDGTEAGFQSDRVGSLTVSTAPGPQITFCQTETLSTQALVNMPSGEITGLVYALGETDMMGAGANVTAELVWGPKNESPANWSNTVAATYKEDVDGLNPNDIANDRFAATITPQMAGDFGYYFRFSLDGGANWVGCDTDGSDGQMASFDPGNTGTLTAQSSNLPDSCRLQFPAVAHNANAALTNQALTFYGRVIEAGVTDMGDGDPSIAAELWVGPPGADPDADPASFDKFTGVLNTSPTGLAANEDEFQYDFMTSTPGTYQYFWRFSVDSGQTWSSCDMDGGSFELSKVGVVEVVDVASPPELVDYCRVWQSNVTKSLADPNEPIFTVEIYEDMVTPPAMQATNLEVEVGYGPQGANPGLPNVFTWVALPYKAPLPSNMSNDEYEGAPYAAGTPPAVGLYDVAVRTRLTGQPWVYCDNDNSNMNYLPEQASTLEITN